MTFKHLNTRRKEYPIKTVLIAIQTVTFQNRAH